MKLLTAFLQMAEEANDYNIVPEPHSEWYRKAKVSRRSFSRSIRTFNDFRLIVKDFFMNDFNRFMLNKPKTDSLYYYLRWLMQFAETTASDNERKRAWQEDCRKELKFAILKFTTEDWMEILAPARELIIKELPNSMDEETNQEIYELWIEETIRELRRWFNHGMNPEEKNLYVKRMLYHLSRLPQMVMEMRAFEYPAEAENVKPRDSREISREIPGYSWYRKMSEQRAREEWKKAHQKEGDEEG